MPHCLKISLFTLLLCSTAGHKLCAQDTPKYNYKYSKKGSAPSKLRNTAEELKHALDRSDDSRAAQQYEALADELTAKGAYAKAESYLKQAQDIYARLRKTDELAVVSRKLAKVQEAQNKIAPAIMNYQSAAGNSSEKSLEQANSNDVQRLQMIDDPRAQKDYAQTNAILLEKSGNKEEAADAYQQLAKTQLQQKDTRGAIESYRKAIDASPDAGTVAQLNKEIADAYVADNKVDEAIAINKSELAKAKARNDIDGQIDQLKELARLYARQKQEGQAEALLLEAYQLALRTGNTIKARDCLMELLQYYEARNDSGRSLALSRTFLRQLDTLIHADSSLVDTKLFELTEGRIRELERERGLQLELIAKKNRFTYFLIVSIAAMLLLLLLVVRSWYAVRAKNKKIALQSLRREMNPHFIFNSLNSVNQYIAENNELEANKYLTSYSGLMRNIMENSNRDFVSLSTEIAQLKKYLDLEQLRFREQFSYRIDVDEELDTDALSVPNMLIQPHLENAIWHGLRYKGTKGLLQLRFQKKDGSLEVTIQDDGIGLHKSQELKTVHQKTHQSRGLTNTRERISLLNDLYKTRIVMHMEALPDEAGGTRVGIRFPLMNKR